MRVTNCKVDHLTDPLGFALEKTTFSWTVEEAIGKKQAAARIVVKKEGETAADTGWTGLDSLAAPVDVPLAPRTRYTWTVAVRSDAGEEAVSGENFFETGKMEEPWAAKWIGCDDSEPRHPVFSKAVAPKKPVARARLYLCGLGLYEASWNGEKIGGEYLTPYCCDYNSWVQYQAFDVTRQLQQAGTLAVELGNGWYRGRFSYDDHTGRPFYGDGWKLLAELRLAYADGTEEAIGTDGSWQVTRSPIFFSNIYDGEQRDDTLPALPAENARLARPPKGALTQRWSTPVTVQEEMPVRELIHTPAGETVLDLGQELTGVFRLKVHVPVGTTVRLQFGEILREGNFCRDNLRTARAEYVYVSDGARRVLEPKFTFYGYRYVKVEGVPGLKAEDFTALVLHSDIPRAGWLETGNPLVNQLISNIEWGQRGNFLDVPTDCPQRDERMGWTGDAQVFAPTACYQRECCAFFAKYLHDMAAEQRENGGKVPDVIPSFGHTGCSAAWGDAACVIPWTLYQFYGDKAVLDRQFDSMKGWVDYITSVDGMDHGWRKAAHYGDWLALDAPAPGEQRGGTDVGFVADSQYLSSVRLTARAARVLGRAEEAEKYGALAERILADIRAEYFTPAGRCAVPTQTGLLLSAAHGLGPDARRTAAELSRRMRQDGGRLKTGFVGTPLLCPTLTDMGESDMAFDLLLNEDYPGWLYEVKLGATTVWERWNSVLPDGSLSDTGMNSLNHYAYGSVAQWLYGDVAGLKPLEPGFRRALLRPQVSAALGHVELTYRSAAGTWKTRWEVLENGDVSYFCAVPFGCTARLELPYGGGEFELESGEFVHAYTPDKCLRVRFSTSTPIADLMENGRARALLEKMIPQLHQLPASMRAMSMRELTAKMGGGMPAGALDRIDRMLSGL